jgi:hypothetical protein
VAGTDPVVNAATAVQRELAAHLGGWLLAASAVVVAAAVLVAVRTSRTEIPA